MFNILFFIFAFTFPVIASSQSQTLIAHPDSGMIVNEQILIDAFNEELGDSIHYIELEYISSEDAYYLKATSYSINDTINVYHWDLRQNITNDNIYVNNDPLSTTITNCKMYRCVCPECGTCPSGSPSDAYCNKLEVTKSFTDGHIALFY